MTPLRDRPRRQGLRRGVAFLLVAVLMSLLAPAARLFGVVGGPLFSFERAASAAASPLLSYLAGKRALAEENASLRASVERLHVAALERDALAAERDALRAELDVPGRDARAIVAEVLLRPPQVAFDSLVLAAGSKDGVTRGDAVLSQGVPVGVIVEALSARSVASLFSAPGSRLSVTVGGQAAEALGRGNGRYAVELPAPLSPATGTAVLSVAHGAAPIGYVAAISAGAGEATVEAQVALPVNLAGARYLTILPSSAGE